MMKPLSIVTTFFLIISSQIFAQNATQYSKAMQQLEERGEVYFRFIVESPSDINYYKLGNIVSLDRIEYTDVFAYANAEEFEKFMKYNFAFEALPPPCFENKVTMSDYKGYLEKGERADWDRYPTYPAYLDMMEKFASDYPELTELEELGETQNTKRKIMGLRVTSKVKKAKPRDCEGGAMHGDEVLTYVILLHMIDTLLSEYGSDQRITRIVDNVDFWFLPLMNPDGTYRGGDNTVQNAQRYNTANSYDLNRNYPCPCLQGNHKYYGLYSTSANETKAVLDLGERYKFNIATNYHGGAEVVVWAYAAVQRRACDEDWLKWASKAFVDQVHDDCNNNGYMTSCGGDGLSRGIDWYECHGVILDYYTYFNNSKGFTKEFSLVKNVPEDQIEKYWNYVKEAMFQHYELLFEAGIQGVVTDSLTGDSILNVEVTAVNYDFDNAQVYTDTSGYYCRYINRGSYTFQYSHDDYLTKNVNNVSLSDYSDKLELNVKLYPKNVTINAVNVNDKNCISILPNGKGIVIRYNIQENADVQVRIYDIKGKCLRFIDNRYLKAGNYSTTLDYSNMPNGTYFIHLRVGKNTITERMIFLK